MIVAYLYLCSKLLHFADDISVSSMEECEENDNDELHILSTTLDMVREHTLECGKWNIYIYM